MNVSNKEGVGGSEVNVLNKYYINTNKQWQTQLTT